jgi:hypothetical protein
MSCHFFEHDLQPQVGWPLTSFAPLYAMYLQDYKSFLVDKFKRYRLNLCLFLRFFFSTERAAELYVYPEALF